MRLHNAEIGNYRVLKANKRLDPIKIGSSIKLVQRSDDYVVVHVQGMRFAVPIRVARDVVIEPID